MRIEATVALRCSIIGPRSGGVVAGLALGSCAGVPCDTECSRIEDALLVLGLALLLKSISEDVCSFPRVRPSSCASMACSCDRTEARVRSSSLSSSSASQASAASCSRRPEIEFVVLDGEVRMIARCALADFLRFGDGVRRSLMPRPESVKCADVESTVSGGRDSKSAYGRLAGGEADTGSGGLSMVARVTPTDSRDFLC